MLPPLQISVLVAVAELAATGSARFVKVTALDKADVSVPFLTCPLYVPLVSPVNSCEVASPVQSEIAPPELFLK